MKLPLAYYGSPNLRKKALPIEKIDDEIRQLVVDMIETMHAHHGIGLAATQVNRLVAVFVTYVPLMGEDDKWHSPEKERVFINPKIISYSEEKAIRNEGCLSIPNIYCDVNRPARIVIQAMDLDGNLIEEEMTGLAACNFMHENDHLNGVLFIDRIDRHERKKLDKALAKIKKSFSK